MGITASHLIADIRNIASSNSNSDNFKASPEQILFWIEEVRSILISQSLAKKDDLNDSWLQTITCVPLIQVDIAECCEIATGCYLLRTENPIPQTIDTYKDNWIVSVTTDSGDIISKSNTFRNRYQMYNKFTSTKPSWYLKNDYLYISNNDYLETINVTALFESPSQLSSYSSCDGEPCWSMDSNFPVTMTLASQITDYIIKAKINPLFTFNSDTSNNASGVTPQQGAVNKQE